MWRAVEGRRSGLHGVLSGTYAVCPCTAQAASISTVQIWAGSCQERAIGDKQDPVEGCQEESQGEQCCGASAASHVMPPRVFAYKRMCVYVCVTPWELGLSINALRKDLDETVCICMCVSVCVCVCVCVMP